MAFTILILLGLLTVPAAEPLRPQATPGGTLTVSSRKSSAVNRAWAQGLLCRAEDVLVSPALVPDRDDNESEEDFGASATAITVARRSGLPFSLLLPARRAPFAPHFSDWHRPLRC